MKNMTALVSCFARCYHTKHNEIKIYDDPYASSILSEEEYRQIGRNMTEGILYFNPHFTGDDPLRWIVNNQLGPSVLARSRIAEEYLEESRNIGVKQYLILASGYDTSGYKAQGEIRIFEVDQEDMIEDKLRRVQLAGLLKNNITYIGCDLRNDWMGKLKSSGYQSSDITYVTCLGISYYLNKEDFANLLMDISHHVSGGSRIFFDYPNHDVSKNERINQDMAKALNEEMKSTYSIDDIQTIARKANLIIEENLNHKAVDDCYFTSYNQHNPNNEIHCPIGVSYCLLTKK